jgi:hypothetical protein
MLMTQFAPEFLDHGVHLVFQVEFLFLESDFLDVVLLGHVMVGEQFFKLPFVQPMFLDQAAEIRIRGSQVILDLLLLHHHRDPPSLLDGLY